MEYETKVELNRDRDTVVTVKCLQSGKKLCEILSGNLLSHCSEYRVGIIKSKLKKQLLEGDYE